MPQETPGLVPHGPIPPDASRYDYRAPGLLRAGLARHFPSLERRDPKTLSWPWLRRHAPHIWRFDTRAGHAPDTGVLSMEEADLLYNNARLMSGARGLEIGCHYAWSTAHLLAAGLRLDVIDPGLGTAAQRDDVTDSLRQVETTGSFHLWAGYSPSVVPAVRTTHSAPWSFAFIDGYHEERAPLDDAEAVSQFCAADAGVMFHDLASPFVAAGLRHFAREGWNVGLYNTMQIMGIAWRGNFTPVHHAGDPAMPAADLPHLQGLKMLTV